MAVVMLVQSFVHEETALCEAVKTAVVLVAGVAGRCGWRGSSTALWAARGLAKRGFVKTYPANQATARS